MAYDVDEPWKDTLVNVHETNIHIMNKMALLRNADKFIEKCMEKI